MIKRVSKGLSKYSKDEIAVINKYSMIQRYQKMEDEFFNRPHTTSKEHDQLEKQYIRSFPEDVQPLAKKVYEKITTMQVQMVGSAIWMKIRYPFLLGILAILAFVIYSEVVPLI